MYLQNSIVYVKRMTVMNRSRDYITQLTPMIFVCIVQEKFLHGQVQKNIIHNVKTVLIDLILLM